MTAPPSSSASAGRAARPPRKRGRLRRFVLTPLLVVLALGVILTRTWVLRAFVEPRLEAALGVDVAMGRVILEPDGRIVIRNLRVSLPGVQRDAAEALRARRLEARIDWSDMVRGELRMTRVTLVRPRVRLSQSLEDDTLNIQAFPGGSASAGAVGALPTVTVVDGILEFGEHTRSAYAALHEAPIEGGATPRKDQPTIYDISLREIVDLRSDGRPSRDPLILAGSVDTANVEGNLRLLNVDLSRWTERTAPARYRDQLRELRIEGVIRETEFGFTRAGGVVAILTLENVGMLLPVDAKPGPGQVRAMLAPPRRMEMRNTSGKIRFDATGVQARGLRGSIEDLTYEVSFVTEGLGLDAPFRMDFRTVDGFTVATSPELLPFAPDIVRRRFATFSGPTAIIDAEVTVRRGAPTAEGPAQPSVSGSLRFRNGAAAYEDFTYPVRSLSGLVEFDDQEIRIESITGVGTTGAKLFADGVIRPPSEGAEVNLNITFADVPIDEEFERSMPESRREIVGALVDREAYARLVEAGLLQPSAARAAAAARLAEVMPRLMADPPGPARDALAGEARELERRLTIPVFDPGGLAALRIRIHRPFGPDSPWQRDIHVTLPSAGLLVRSFPYPVMASNVDVRIGDQFADVDIPALEGLTGARGSLVARICLEAAGRSVFEPEIFVAATDAPVDELLIQAAPGDPDAAFSAPRLLRLLRLEGGVDCAAHITPRGEGEVGFDVAVRLDGLAARPDNPATGAMPDEPLVAGLTGEVNISERGLYIESLTGLIGEGRVDIRAEAQFPREGRAASFESEIALTRLDLRAPIERVVTALSPEAGAVMSELRATRNPSGLIDARIAIGSAAIEEGASTGAVQIDARIERAEGFAFDLYGRRLETGLVEGGATVSERRVVFDDLTTSLAFGGAPAGHATLNGALHFPGTPQDKPASLHLLLEGAPVESALVRSTLSDRNQEAGRWLDAFGARGVFDLDATLDTAPGEPARLSAEIRPRALAFTRDGLTMDFPSAEGAVSFTAPLGPGAPAGVAGSIDELTLRSDDWMVTASGPWRSSGETSLDLTIGAAASRLDERVQAALPEAVAEVLRQLDVRTDGPVRLTDATLRYDVAEGVEPSLLFDGLIGFERASFEPGLSVTEATGSASVRVERRPGLSMHIDLGFFAESLRVAGLRTTNARARVVSGQSEGEALIPVFEADAHTGRIAGTARIAPAAGGAGLRRYEASVRAAGVNFGSLLADLTPRPAEGERPIAPGTEPASGAPATDRGLVDASLSIEGLVGAPDTRIGRGSATVSGGRVIRLPLLLQLIELSNLQIPSGEPLDEARAAFYIDGDTVTFEDLGVASGAVDIVGRGSLRWSDLGLDLRFTSRSKRRLLLVSDLLEGLRDELATISVTGTLAEPDFGVEQLTGTRRLLESILGPGADDRRPIRPSIPDERP